MPACLSSLCCHQVIHDPEQKQMVMIMEYLPGGSILSATNVPAQTEPLSEDVAVQYFRCVNSRLHVVLM